MATDKVVRMDYYGMLKYARALAASEGLGVTYFDPSPECPAVPFTSRDSIHLPRPNPTWSDEEWTRWVDSASHEIGHNMPENRDGFDLLDELKIDTRSFYGSALNLIDDSRTDRTRCEKYRGMLDYHNKGQSYHMSKIGEMDFKKITDNYTNKNAKAIQTMVAFDTIARQDWLKSMQGMEFPLVNQMDQEQLQWLEKLTDKYLDEYKELSKCKDEKAFLDKILKEVFEIDPEEEQKKAQQQAKQGKGKQSKDGQPQQSKGKGQGKPEKGEGEESEEGQGDHCDYEEFLNHKPEETEKASQNSQDMHIDYSSYSGERSYSPHTDDTTKLIDWQSGKVPSNFTNSGYYRNDERDVHNKIAALNIPVMVGEARRLLQVMTRKRNYYNQKKGRLDTSKVYRVCSPDEGLQERIFKTKTENQALDTAVSILVDYSGSMSGTKCQTAIAGAVALEQLCKMMRIPVEVGGFTENGYQCNYHYIFKNFARPVQDDKFIRDMCQGTAIMGGNADGDNILVAFNRLMQQKTRRKVLIVLSDGSPASSRGDCYAFTKRIVQGIQARNDVDIIGIGIHDDNVTGIYKHHKVIWKIEELPKALIQTLEHCVLENIK